MRVSKFHQYVGGGFECVYLVNGFTRKKTSDGPTVNFSNLEGLHVAMGKELIKRRQALSGKEFRFLRLQLRLPQKELARLLDVKEQTVRRWELDEVHVPRVADVALRAMFLEKVASAPVPWMVFFESVSNLPEEADKALWFVNEAGAWSPVRETAKAAA